MTHPRSTGNDSVEIGDDFDWLDTQLRRFRRHAEFLTDGEIRFVDDMFVKTGKFGDKTFLSKRQRSWIESIERRLDDPALKAADGIPDDWDKED